MHYSFPFAGQVFLLLTTHLYTTLYLGILEWLEREGEAEALYRKALGTRRAAKRPEGTDSDLDSRWDLESRWIWRVDGSGE